MEGKSKISNSEKQIILLLSHGYSNQTISEQTGISVNTVKYHLKKIYKKLGAKNRIDAINKFNKHLNINTL